MADVEIDTRNQTTLAIAENHPILFELLSDITCDDTISEDFRNWVAEWMGF